MKDEGLRIGLTGRDLLGWQGGRELFQLMAGALRASLRDGDTLALVRQDRSLLRRVAGAGKRHVRRLAGRRDLPTIPDAATLMGSDWPIRDLAGDAFDVIGPVTHLLDSPLPQLGYIPDVQHRRLPDMFSARERSVRDRTFARLLERTPVVLVNAADVAEDLRRFFPQSRATLVPLPFAACAEPDWFVDDADVAARYGVEEPYFLCSNQFWQHKNHGVILAALALAKAKGVALRVVFTGDTRDYRHPRYFPGLLERVDRLGIADRVHMLGYIPKRDQVALMRRAVAVVQPSLFEGAPGGGAIYNAVALGVPTIVSDLPVNREIATEVTHFFDPADPRQLLDAMRQAVAAPRPPVDTAALLRAGEERRRGFGDALRQAFAAAARF